MLQAQGATTVPNKMHVVYETGSCNILMVKEQLSFNNKNTAYIIKKTNTVIMYAVKVVNIYICAYS